MERVNRKFGWYTSQRRVQADETERTRTERRRETGRDERRDAEIKIS